MNNDRFLFRYYSKQENRYLLNSEIQAIFGMSCLIQKVKDTGLQAVRVSLNGERDDLYATEQCTGMKDKNGKLIYEGDMLKRGPKTGIIEFHDYSFRIRFPKTNNLPAETYYLDYWISVLGSHKKTIEIIGNIHEVKE